MYDGVVEALQKRQDASMGAHGTVINVVSWLLTVIALCTLVARFAMKFCIKDKSRRFGLDDLFIILAAIFSIGQTIAVSIEAIQVLGQHFVDLDQHQKITMQKAEYAGCILYLANMGSARISLCLLIKKILPGTIARYTALVFIGFTALWTISGILVTAFSCKLPHPWIFSNPSACINLVSWVNYIGITNIVVEILLVLIPLVIWNLRTSVGKTTSVSLMFLARLSIVGAVAAQLHFYNRYTSQYYVDIYQYWRTVLCVQIAQNLSIITASLPCLHPFIIKVLAGTVNTDELMFDCEREARQMFFGKGKVVFDPTSSHSSALPINEKKEAISYCAPLATYGLDRSSAHLNSQHFNRFPSNVATPVSENDEPFQNIFMAPVEVAPSRPPTSHSATSGTSAASPPQVPNTLAEVGCLPVIDWDTESSDRGSGRSTPSRRRNSEYVFNRSKVISVPEESHLKDAEGAYCKKYHPPLPSPKMPKKPPRNF